MAAASFPRSGAVVVGIKLSAIPNTLQARQIFSGLAGAWQASVPKKLSIVKRWRQFVIRFLVSSSIFIVSSIGIIGLIAQILLKTPYAILAPARISFEAVIEIV